jgi:sugar phosphate isomerase/epimerase
MKVGAATFYGLLHKSLPDICIELQKNGIDAVEVMWEWPHKPAESEAPRLKRLGLDFSVHGPFTEKTFAHPDPEMRIPQIRMVEKSLAFAARLEADVFVMHGGLFPTFYTMIESSLARERFLKSFAGTFLPIFRKASDAGVRVVIENVSTSNQLFSAPEDFAFAPRKGRASASTSPMPS